jgi:hypothetical protein
MADSRDQYGSNGSAVLAGAITGAVLGAVGFAWWLRKEAERRQFQEREQRLLRLSRLQGGSPEIADHDDRLRNSQPAEASAADRRLHDKVNQLNLAIEDVRRQLERLQPQA